MENIFESFRDYINESADVNYKKWKKFINELISAKDEKSQLKIFKQYNPDGVYGEDFYPGPISDKWYDENMPKANDILDNLIEKGYMKYENDDEPEGNIIYVK
jgi:hypothetical protein